MHKIQSFLGDHPAELHAQAYLEDWYCSLGWSRHGDGFEEAGIPHVLMRRNID
jgi:predicted GNAT family N-acyltransferase